VELAVADSTVTNLKIGHYISDSVRDTFK